MTHSSVVHHKHFFLLKSVSLLVLSKAANDPILYPPFMQKPDLYPVLLSCPNVPDSFTKTSVILGFKCFKELTFLY
jgi:hypothetical protein